MDHLEEHSGTNSHSHTHSGFEGHEEEHLHNHLHTHYHDHNHVLRCWKLVRKELFQELIFFRHKEGHDHLTEIVHGLWRR